MRDRVGVKSGVLFLDPINKLQALGMMLVEVKKIIHRLGPTPRNVSVPPGQLLVLRDIHIDAVAHDPTDSTGEARAVRAALAMDQERPFVSLKQAYQIADLVRRW